MFSVFSNKPNGQLPSEYIKQLSKCAGSYLNRLLFAGPPDEPMYILRPKAQKLLIWINNKILYQLPYISYQTAGVRVRIATGMLNNLEKDGILDKEVCLIYHKRLTERVKEISSAIQLEEIPF